MKARPPVRTRQELAQALTVSVRDYCELTGLGETAVRAAIKRGEVPLIRHGRAFRIPASHVRLLLGVALAEDVPPVPPEVTTW